MSYFVTADTHFGHAKIIGYCDRPFSSVEEMNKGLVDNWNSVVKPEDVVFHLGDVGFGKSGFSCVSQCNGRKILIRGNHDSGVSSSAFIRHGFEAVYKRYENPFVYYPRGLNSEACRVIFSHFPEEASFPTPNIPCLCGHVHEKWDYRNGWLNVGVDVWNFKPILLSHAVETWNAARQLGTFMGF